MMHWHGHNVKHGFLEQLFVVRVDASVKVRRKKSEREKTALENSTLKKPGHPNGQRLSCWFFLPLAASPSTQLDEAPMSATSFFPTYTAFVHFMEPAPSLLLRPQFTGMLLTSDY